MRHFQWSEKHNNGCLAGLRALFPASSLNPRLSWLQLSRKPCSIQIHTKIVEKFDFPWTKNANKTAGFSFGPTRVSFLVPSLRKWDKRIENHWWRRWNIGDSTVMSFECLTLFLARTFMTCTLALMDFPKTFTIWLRYGSVMIRSNVERKKMDWQWDKAVE